MEFGVLTAVISEICSRVSPLAELLSASVEQQQGWIPVCRCTSSAVQCSEAISSRGKRSPSGDVRLLLTLQHQALI